MKMEQNKPPTPTPERRVVEKMRRTSSIGSSGAEEEKTSASSVSLVPLSLIWIGLCTGLVLKDNNLILVFYSFCASFALAALLRPIAAASLSASAPTEDSDNDRRLKYLVGLVDCSVALAILSFSLSPTDNTTAGTEYTALSVIAGYLAFDHWHSALHRCREDGFWWSGAGGVVEDALTLISAVTVLATSGDSVGRYRAGIVAWLAYKMARLILSLRLLIGRNTTTTSSTTAGSSRLDQPSLRPAAVPLSDAVMSKAALNSSHNMDSPTTAAASTAAAGNTKTKAGSVTAPGTNYWEIRGIWYDLSEYVQSHPGGVDAILLGQNRDCTALFQSYHPFTSRHIKILQKYRIDIDDSSSASSDTDGNSLNNEDDIVDSFECRDPFYYLLRDRVYSHLKSKGIDPIEERSASWSRALYYAWILSALVLSGIRHCQGSLVGSFLFAVFGWLIGSLGHDAGHFCASRRPWVNGVGVWAMMLLCNPVLWQHQHTYAHHSHTNQFDHDPDLHHFTTLLRVHRKFQLERKYKLQSNVLYVVLAYVLVVFGTCVWIPWGVLKDGALYGMVEISGQNAQGGSNRWQGFGMLFHVALYVALTMLAPFFGSRATWISAPLSFVVHATTSGLLFAFFSQINHLNEASIVILDDKNNNRDRKNGGGLDMNDSWAVNQIETSNNFAPDSVLWHVLSNGLNLQIEHHLFPGINHCHLHHIVPVVKATCEEYGVQYKSYNNWCEIFNATLNWLDVLAKEVDEDAGGDTTEPGRNTAPKAKTT